jgi:histidine biosynthesis protein
MPEFILMLTLDDRTIDRAIAVYHEVRDTGIRYVGFKDVGLPFDQLRYLSAAIRSGGQNVVLEVVSEYKKDELRSARAAADLGVDYLLGGTHAEEVTAILTGTGILYYPFPGRVIGHPSRLRGSIHEIVASARHLASIDGVHGLDLLAHRYDGDVDALVRAVVQGVNVPVIAAGSIDSAEKIKRLAEAGVWGFTIGTAIFKGTYSTGLASVREMLKGILEASVPPGSDNSSIKSAHPTGCRII